MATPKWTRASEMSQGVYLARVALIVMVVGENGKWACSAIATCGDVADKRPELEKWDRKWKERKINRLSKLGSNSVQLGFFR